MDYQETLIRDFSVNVRLYNNQLRQRRLDAGLSNNKLAKAVGVSPEIYGKMERITFNPLRRTRYGQTHLWKKAVVKLAKFWEVPAPVLFPEVVRSLEKCEVEFTADAAGLSLLGSYSHRAALPMDSGESTVEQREVAKLLSEAVHSLPEKLGGVLQMRFVEELTLEEVGNELGVCRERVRQLEQKGLRMLRHPTRTRALRGLGPRVTIQEIEEHAKEIEETRVRIEAEESARNAPLVW